MEKWKLIIFLALFALPIVQAENITCEYSFDNTTWINITHLIDPINNCLQTGLSQDTQIFARIKNETTDFNYFTFRTLEALPVGLTNIFIYMSFMLIVLILIVFMHHFKDRHGSSIVYGWFATAVSTIIGAMLLSNSFTVVPSTVLFFDIDSYLAILSFMIALYTGMVSVNLYKQTRPKEDDI